VVTSFDASSTDARRAAARPNLSTHSSTDRRFLAQGDDSRIVMAESTDVGKAYRFLGRLRLRRYNADTVAEMPGT